MIDLRPMLQRAIAAKDQWKELQVHALLDAIAARIPDSRVDWESGDEAWGRVVRSDDSVAALVCSKIPLVFASGPEVDRVTVENEAVWVTAIDLAAPSFSVDKQELEGVFGRKLSDNVDYEALSALDLWWATV